MNALLDDSLVGLLLAAAAAYALLVLGPKALRRRALDAFATLLARAPSFLRLGAAAQRLARKAIMQAPGACGGCDGCATEARQAGNDGEVSVSLDSIPRARPKNLQ